MVPVSSAESMRGATWTRRGCLVWWSEHRVRIVDADSGAVVGEWSHGDVVAGCRPLRDDGVASYGIGDETLVAVTGDRCLHVFDAGRGVATVEAHRDTVLGIVASPDRSRLLSWSADRTARLWSADELRPT